MVTIDLSQASHSRKRRSFLALAWKLARIALVIVFFTIALSGDTTPTSDPDERVRAFTRSFEFDYVSWTLDALYLKLSQAALGAPDYLSEAQQVQMVKDYLRQVQVVSQLDRDLTLIYADPAITDRQSASAPVRTRLAQAQARLDDLAKVAEGVLQQQVAQVAAEQGLTLGGQPVPPVLYHVTPLPSALIISPRNAIRADHDISLSPGLSAADRDTIEDRVASSLNVSALIVPIGGIGIYPTMVMSTTDLVWLAEVVSHEWTHNFLTLRPLGVIYDTSPELRVINETTASLVGRELGMLVIKRYYPEYAPAETDTAPEENQPQSNPNATPVFNFRKEMRITRIHVDALLAQGKIAEAETYMETRRRFFWDHGYLIRKLNQAYFAFYGAYNDPSGGGGSSGAAGSDPIGPAIAALRQKSKSLGTFLNRISWVTSFEQLQRLAQN